MMINNYIAITIFSGMLLVGCGSSTDTTDPVLNDDTSGNGPEPTRVTKVTVEKGPVYDATVTDSTGQTGTQDSGQNIYTFPDTVNYPVLVNGGWVDVDGDGQKTASDIMLTLPMKSYTENVTPVTTYIADADEAVRAQRLQDLADITGVSKEELLNLPSQGSVEAMLVNNTVYKQIKINDDDIDAVGLDAIKSGFDDLNTLVSQREDVTGDALVVLIEQEVISDLVSRGKVAYVEEATEPIPTPTNQAPIAKAGADQTVKEGSVVSFNASGSSDSDGTISSYQWKEGSKVLSNSVSFTKADFSVGAHTVNLTVTDDDGATASDTVVITVNKANIIIKN